MEIVMKLLDIRICLWGMFVAGLAFMAIDGITPIGVLAVVVILLMAIDYPKREKRNKK